MKNRTRVVGATPLAARLLCVLLASSSCGQAQREGGGPGTVSRSAKTSPEATIWGLDDARLRLAGNVFTMAPLKASPALQTELGQPRDDARGKVTLDLYDLTMLPEAGRDLDEIISTLRRQE